jgi:hypothetical protein
MGPAEDRRSPGLSSMRCGFRSPEEEEREAINHKRVDRRCQQSAVSLRHGFLTRWRSSVDWRW